MTDKTKNIDFNKNYYQILGVPETSNKDEIKKQYYEMAKKFHPDVYKGNEDKFKAISQAYEILKDDTTKKYYDNMRKNPLHSAKTKNDFHSTYGYGYTRRKYTDPRNFYKSSQSQNFYQNNNQQQQQQQQDFYSNANMFKDFYQNQQDQYNQQNNDMQMQLMKQKLYMFGIFLFGFWFFFQFLLQNIMYSSSKRQQQPSIVYDQQTNRFYAANQEAAEYLRQRPELQEQLVQQNRKLQRSSANRRKQMERANGN